MPHVGQTDRRRRHQRRLHYLNASYSADTIGLEGRVRKPFRWMNALWIWTGIHSKAGTRGAEAYRLVPGVEEQDAAILKMLGQKEADQLTN